MNKVFLIFLFLIAVILTVGGQTVAQETANTFIIKDIRYQGFDGTGKLEIEINEHIDYIIYELEDPYRIVIDPLDAVWCDFEQVVYFDKGVVKSIKFIEGRKVQEAPGQAYYPFDFVTVELRNSYPYDTSEDEYVITLNIGEAKTPPLEPRIEIIPLGTVSVDRARAIEDEFVKEAEKRTLDTGKKLAKKKREIEDSKVRLDKEKKRLAEERKRLEKDKSKLKEKEEKQINIAKDELSKEKTLLKKEKIKLAKERKRLEKDKTKLKKREKELKRRKEKFEPRPVKEFLEKPLPPDYLGKELTLEDCIQIAMSNSFPVKVAKERIELAKLKVNEAFRELFPEASLMWDESRGMISQEHYVGRKFGFEFKQAIFHGGEQMYLWKQSKTNLKVAKENLNKAKEDLIFDVTKTYYELAKAVNKYDLQKKLKEDIDLDFETVKKEYEFGLVSQIDFMSTESLINQAYHTLLSYENSLSLAKLELNKILNIDMNADIKIDSRMEQKELDIDLNKCIEIALKFRPEHRISYLNTEVAKLTEKIARGQTFPQIDIFAKYLKAIERLEPIESLKNHLENERVLGATFSVPWGPHTIDYQKKIAKLAPTVTTFESDTRSSTDKYRISLFDNMARQSNIKDASISYKEALDELNKAEQNIQTDIREALFSFRESKIKIINALNNIELYTKELEVARMKKGLNEISFYDLIQAKEKLYTENGVYTDVLGDYHIAIARVNKAIGLGGYFN